MEIPLSYFDEPIVDTISPPSLHSREKGILLLEAILNSEPLSPLPHTCKLFSEVRNELRIVSQNDETSINEPSECPVGNAALIKGDVAVPQASTSLETLRFSGLRATHGETFQALHYASKTMNEAEITVYTTDREEMLAVDAHASYLDGHDGPTVDISVKDCPDCEDSRARSFHQKLHILNFILGILDSPFELVAYTDSDYAGATLDKKSTTGGCQFLGNSTLDSKPIAGLWDTDIQEKEQKESQKQTKPSMEWKGLRMFLSQCKYAVEILQRAHMANCNPSRTPVDTESKLGDDGDPISDPTLYQNLAGSLQYLTFTRLDISYAV
ncbi:ribonuclease H-like domain-containing protein [Tanacetum coccineum]